MVLRVVEEALEIESGQRVQSSLLFWLLDTLKPHCLDSLSLLSLSVITGEDDTPRDLLTKGTPI